MEYIKDRDLYNWKVGADYPDANWTQKKSKKEIHYSIQDLDKVKLSFPCLVGVVPVIK